MCKQDFARWREAWADTPGDDGDLPGRPPTYPRARGHPLQADAGRVRGNVPGLYAKYLYGDLCTGNIWAQKPYARPIRLNISGQVSSLVSFGEGNSGEVYVVSINGSVWRLSA